MNKLKVAILEDSKELLKNLKQNLEKTKLVDVVAFSTNSEDFLEKVSKCNPDALFLDIDLKNDSMSGLDIAYEKQLPVLFVSGKTQEFYSQIEELNLNSKNVIEHITKPITVEKLNKILPKFIKAINAFNETKYVFLDFASSKRNKISIDTIVYIGTDKANGAESNNKEIFFTDRKPEVLIDFSFTKMEEKGLNKNVFIQIHKSYRVNVYKILEYTRDHEVKLKIIDDNNVSRFIKLHVSENYRQQMKNYK